MLAARPWSVTALSALVGLSALSALSACSQPAIPPPIVPEHTPHSREACTLPSGVKLRELPPRERGLVLRRVFACNDLRRGRITQADYVRMIAAIDAEWAALPARSPPPPRSLVWASSVRGFSTQYGDPQWSATQVLGPPDVFPRHGDIPQSWASLGPDDRTEWITVGFDRATTIAAVEVYETYNPGAVSRVVLTADDGSIIDAPLDRSTADTSPEGSVRRRFELPCTRRPIRTVRLELDSMRVTGWNEIDAIGIMPCEP